MKHIATAFAILLAVAGCHSIALAQGDNIDWIEKWHFAHPQMYDENDQNNWMYGDRMYTGLAYDTTRDVVYVVSPDANDPRIRIFDAESGAPMGAVNVDTSIVKGGYGAGKFALFKVDVDDEGRIYACNAVSPGSDPGLPFRVYRWDTPASTPVLVYEYLCPQTIELFGTSFEVTGKRHNIGGTWHDSTRIYVSTGGFYPISTSADELHILAGDQSANPPSPFRLIKRIVNPTGQPRYFGAGIAPYDETATADVFVAAPGGTIRKIRQQPDTPTPPLVYDVITMDTIPDMPSDLLRKGGPMSIFKETRYHYYVFVGNLIPSSSGPGDTNFYTWANVILKDDRGNWPFLPTTWPGGPTPPLGNRHPASLAGGITWISDIDHKIARPQGGSKYEQVYYLIPNGGIICYMARNPLQIPIELSSFTGLVEGSLVTLDWRTASETNNYGFDIERSVDTEWDKVGFVRGNGTTTAASEYQWHDTLTADLIARPLIRYRLKQIDFDQTFEYSSAIHLAPTPINDLPGAAYDIVLRQNHPNPFHGYTDVPFSVPYAQEVTLAVYTLLGQEVQSIQRHAEPGRNNIRLSNLKPGLYLAVLRGTSGVKSLVMVGR